MVGLVRNSGRKKFAGPRLMYYIVFGDTRGCSLRKMRYEIDHARPGDSGGAIVHGVPAMPGAH